MPTTPNPNTYFANGHTIEFTSVVSLPEAAYQSPNVNELVLTHFNDIVKTNLRMLNTLAAGMGTGLFNHSNALTALISKQLLTDKEFVNAFRADITIDYGLNIADQGMSVALSMVVKIDGTPRPIVRQFFHSTVRANTGKLPNGRTYGNSSDTITP